MQPESTAQSFFSLDRWRRLKTGAAPSRAGVVYAYALLLGIFIVAASAKGKPSYVSGENIANILDQSSLAAILAIFLTVVLISGNFDLSVGSVAALSAVVSLQVIDSQGLVLGMLVGLAIGAAIGLINGAIVEYIGINAFIVTLGTLTAVRGLVLIISGGNSIIVEDPNTFPALNGLANDFWTVNLLLAAGVLVLIGVFAIGVVNLTRGTSARLRSTSYLATAGVGLLAVIVGLVAPVDARWSHPVWFMLAIGVVTWAVLRYTVVGRRLYAVGGNHEAARLSGIRVRRYRVMPFILSGTAAGFVGVVYGAKLGAVNPDAMTGMELTVIAAAILGGTSLFGGSGSVVMSIFGTLFLFTIANGFNVLNLGSNYQGLIQGVILILAAGIYTVARRREQLKVIDTADALEADQSPTGTGSMSTSRVG